MNGVELISAERARQIEQENWSEDHDDLHVRGELAKAASIYAMPKRARKSILSKWPWGRKWYKPSDDRVKELVKAGALIAAEIDRIQRIEYWR